MNGRCFYIALIGIAAVVPLGFAGTFPGRPTVAGMDTAVELGTECGYGVRERCLATQYATNPAAYSVDPPPIMNGWYLDQATMSGLDAKTLGLITHYVDTNELYEGSTSSAPARLSVTALFAQLQIGDGTNQFTQTPALGTNPATYGSWPWQIYTNNLVERYKALSELSATSIGFGATNGSYRGWGRLFSHFDRERHLASNTVTHETYWNYYPASGYSTNGGYVYTNITFFPYYT